MDDGEIATTMNVAGAEGVAHHYSRHHPRVHRAVPGLESAHWSEGGQRGKGVVVVVVGVGVVVA